jgi:hypothetical protein
VRSSFVKRNARRPQHRGVNNGVVRRLTRYGPAVYFPGSLANEVDTADDSPITVASGEHHVLPGSFLARLQRFQSACA